MQAVIMAAGKSTRTYPLTVTRPKPLVPLWERPLLEHQLRQLDGLVDEVILVVGFLKEQIEDRFGDSFGGMRLSYVVQEQQRGTADALLAARPRIARRALVLNGDDFYHHDDLKGLAERGRGLLVAQVSDPQNRAVVSLEGERITGIVEKPENPEHGAWCSIGGYSIEPGDLGRLDDVRPSPRGELELPDFILDLVRSHDVRAKKIDRLWLPLTYSWDALATVLFLWERPERASELGLAAESPESIRARADLFLGKDVTLEGPIRLGSEVSVGDGARLLGPLSIGYRSSISAGARLERSVLFDRVRVGAGVRVQDSILGEGVSVGALARLESRPGAEIEIDVKGKKVVPEIPRLGVVAGDGVSIGEGAVVPAGTILAPT